MRTHGTLKKWNDARGFGFISPAQGTEEIFVHISAFPRDGMRPLVGELISFETERGDNGKLRAFRVMRASRQTSPGRAPAARESRGNGGLASILVALLPIAALGYYGYSQYDREIHGREFMEATSPEAVIRDWDDPSPAPTQAFECDGRTKCSQMRSCEEAVFFLRNCPNTTMDGNNDGEPCESQWCY